MHPIELLEQEHRAIERVLETLDQYADAQLGSSTPTTQRDLLQFAEFIQQFADRIHHGKEEDILFEQMVRAGFPTDSGPLAVMYHEHEKGRAFARKLKSLGEKDSQWSQVDREHLKQVANGYTTLLRQHISKEDNILYPMAQTQLGSEGMDLIADAFAEFESKDEQSGEKERLLSMADSLAERYGTQGHLS